MNLFIDFFLFLIIVVPLSTLAHETGHALTAHLCGAEKIEIYIGSGKEIARKCISGLTFIVKLNWVGGGSTSGLEKHEMKQWQGIAISLGGPLASGIVAFLFHMIHMTISEYVLQLAFLFNLWLACINIIPFKIGGLESDGYTALLRLREKD